MKFDTFTYASGGACYALSSRAVKTIVEKGIGENVCKYGKLFQDIGGIEDMFIGACLSMFNVTISDVHDKFGRQTFHPFAATVHFDIYEHYRFGSLYRRYSEDYYKRVSTCRAISLLYINTGRLVTWLVLDTNLGHGELKPTHSRRRVFTK